MIIMMGKEEEEEEEKEGRAYLPPLGVQNSFRYALS